MEKKELARIRNWTKARLISFKFNTKGLTSEEKVEINNIRSSIENLLDAWDDRSRELDLKIVRYDLYVTNAGIETLWKRGVPYSTIRFLIKGLSKEQYRIVKYE